MPTDRDQDQKNNADGPQGLGVEYPIEKRYLITESQLKAVNDALFDASSFYDAFDDDNEGRGEIIRKGEAATENLAPAGGCEHWTRKGGLEMPLFEITESCVSAIKSLVRAETEEEAKRKFYEDGAYVVTTREDVESQLESITEVEEDERSIGAVAASYELTCDCRGSGYEGGIQLTELEQDEHGLWIWDCPECAYRHVFDGGEVEHAF